MTTLAIIAGAWALLSLARIAHHAGRIAHRLDRTGASLELTLAGVASHGIKLAPPEDVGPFYPTAADLEDARRQAGEEGTR